MIIPWEHPGQLLPRLAAPFGPFDSMLDVGGGPGHIGMGQWGTDNIHILDIWQPKPIPPRFTLGNVLDCERIYGPKSFDLVVAAYGTIIRIKDIFVGTTRKTSLRQGTK